MNKKTIKDIDIKGKKVLIRVDFNVPLDGNLKITDNIRIAAAVPTIQYAIKQNAKVILMSHLGRPDGKVVDKMRMDPVAKELSRLLGRQVKKVNDCAGAQVKAEADKLKYGDVLLLENLRFHAEEEDNDPGFSKQLASLADIYVNDAFGTAHRAHASTEGVTKYLPSVAGFLLQKEIDYLGTALENPKKPFIAILGGAKVSDKIGVIENLLPKVDAILIGGGMAYTFLKAKGRSIGNSKLEADKVPVAQNLLKKAEIKKVKIVLPVDHIIADKFDAKANIKEQATEDIPDGWMALDIGPKTIKLFCDALKPSKTIVWNGPLGVFEMESFSYGTKNVAEYIAKLKGVTSIIGGGDTAAAISKFNLENKMTHISTGGGASLEFLEGRPLPGVVALNDKNEKKGCCCCP